MPRGDAVSSGHKGATEREKTVQSRLETVVTIGGCNWCKFPGVSSQTAVYRVVADGTQISRHATAIAVVAGSTVTTGQVTEGISRIHMMFRHGIAWGTTRKETVHLQPPNEGMDPTPLTGESATIYLGTIEVCKNLMPRLARASRCRCIVFYISI